MAKNIGIIKFTGKIAEVTGGVATKGYNYLRRSAEQVKNPNTPGQRVQRTKFLCASGSSANIPLEAIAGLAPAAQSGLMSLRNKWTQELLRNRGLAANNWIEVTGDGEEGTTVTARVNPLTVGFAQGPLSFVENPTISGDTPGNVTFNLPDQGDAAEHQAFHLVIFSQEFNEIRTAVLRADQYGDQEYNFPCPANWNGTKVYAYAYLEDFAANSEAFDNWYVSEIYTAESYSNSRTSADARRAFAASKYSPSLYLGSITLG